MRLGVNRVEPSRFRQMLPPVRRGEAILAHPLAGGRSVHELSVAHVDSDVRVLPAFQVEKHQISMPQIRHANAPGSLSLLLGAAWKRHACLPKAELNEPAAIEPGCGGGAAGPVGLAHHFHCVSRSAVRCTVAGFYARYVPALRSLVAVIVIRPRGSTTG